MKTTYVSPGESVSPQVFEFDAQIAVEARSIRLAVEHVLDSMESTGVGVSLYAAGILNLRKRKKQSAMLWGMFLLGTLLGIAIGFALCISGLPF